MQIQGGGGTGTGYMCGSRGDRGPGPPGKSQVIGNKQVDPP